MSVSGGLEALGGGPAVWLRRVRANAAGHLAVFRRKRRFTGTCAWRSPVRIWVGALTFIVLVVASMGIIDASAVAVAQRTPEWLTEIFDRITQLGKSVWLLAPIALALAMIAAISAAPGLSRMSQRLLAATAVQLAFLVVAVGLPGLVFTVLKRLIGRARPLVEGSADPFIYLPLGWNVQYASFPSGHATDAFAIAAAIGALWPRLRVLMWGYAIAIAASRVVLTAHFPSDVIAGAVVGVVGALLVRDWFAARGLAFVIGANGAVRPMASPSFRRIKRVAGQLVGP